MARHRQPRWVSRTSFSPASLAYALLWIRQPLTVHLSMFGIFVGVKKTARKMIWQGVFQKKGDQTVNLLKVKPSGSELACQGEKLWKHHVCNISKALLYTLCSQYIFNFKGSIFKSGNTIGPFSRQWCLFRRGLVLTWNIWEMVFQVWTLFFWVAFFKGHLWTTLLFQKGEEIRGVFF